MTSDHSNSSNPAFKTPQPDQLQDQESQEAVRQRLVEEQGSETDVIDQDAAKQNHKPTDSVDVIDNMDNLADRHPLSIDSPPG